MCILLFIYLYYQGVKKFLVYDLQFYSLDYKDFLNGHNAKIPSNPTYTSTDFENNKIIHNRAANKENKILSTENQNLKNEIDEVQVENDVLKERINKLKKTNETLKNENQELKIYNEKLMKEKDDLNTELIKAYKLKIVSTFNNPPQNQKENNNTINNLNEMIEMKDKEINELKAQLQNSGNLKKSVNFDDIIVVNFISLDQKINKGIKCMKTDTFAEVEEQLYKIYGEYRETNNNFIANGTLVLRFKKMCENKIKDNDTIQLIPFE